MYKVPVNCYFIDFQLSPRAAVNIGSNVLIELGTRPKPKLVVRNDNREETV